MNSIAEFIFDLLFIVLAIEVIIIIMEAGTGMFLKSLKHDKDQYMKK